MKKLLLAGALAIVGIFSAQDKGLQGTWFATAQVGYQQTEDGAGGKSTNTTILPIVGTFVAPTTAVGIAVGNIGVKAEDFTFGGTQLNGVTLKTNLLVVEPLVRKYWGVSGGLFFFGQLAAPIVAGKAKFSGAPLADVKVSQFGLAMSGGFDYVMTKHFTVEFSYNLANLSFTTIKNYPGTTGDIKTTDFSLAHVATVAPEYNQAIFGANGNAVTPLSFGFKFLF